MPWQRVAEVDREKGSLILENSDGEQYELEVFLKIEELQKNHQVNVLVKPYPKWEPPRLQAWWTCSPDSKEDA